MARRKTPTAIELLRRQYQEFKTTGKKPKGRPHDLQTCHICGHKAPKGTMYRMGRDRVHGGEELFRCYGCKPGSKKWAKFIERNPKYKRIRTPDPDLQPEDHED